LYNSAIYLTDDIIGLMEEIILASTSPRRKELLEKAGIKFKAVSSNINEYFDPKLTPHELVRKLSLEKAKAVQKKFKSQIIIAADTIVFVDGIIFGKPKDIIDARKMLEYLSGKTHSIITGFAIINGKTGKTVTKSEETRITMREISEKEINTYLKTKEPYDKAGAYAIQGKAAKFITKIDGDLFSAIGLPINTVLKELKTL
jgi:septum formation protein